MRKYKIMHFIFLYYLNKNVQILRESYCLHISNWKYILNQVLESSYLKSRNSRKVCMRSEWCKECVLRPSCVAVHPPLCLPPRGDFAVVS